MSVSRFGMITLLAVFFGVFAFGAEASAKLTHEDARQVWSEIAKETDLTKLPFSVKEEKIPNAWVANGESVTVTTGLLNLLATKEELYGVLAHEAGHVKLNHYGNTVSKNAGLSIGAAILGNLLGGGLGGVAVNVGANLAAAGFSREQEVAADDYSVKLAHDNGRDPVGMYSAMQRLSAYGGKLEPSGFNSHPPDERRLLHIKNEILKYNPDAKIPEPIAKPAASGDASAKLAADDSGQPQGTEKLTEEELDAMLKSLKKD